MTYNAWITSTYNPVYLVFAGPPLPLMGKEWPESRKSEERKEREAPEHKPRAGGLLAAGGYVPSGNQEADDRHSARRVKVTGTTSDSLLISEYSKKFFKIFQ